MDLVLLEGMVEKSWRLLELFVSYLGEVSGPMLTSLK